MVDDLLVTSDVLRRNHKESIGPIGGFVGFALDGEAISRLAHRLVTKQRTHKYSTPPVLLNN